MAAPSRAQTGWAALATVAVMGFEGCRTYAYRDPVGIPTICFGETRGVKMGQHHTLPECKELLTESLQEFNDGINKCVHVPMGDKRRASVVSFSYNVGLGAFCRSTFARKLNAEDPQACNELLKWTRAGPFTLPGLVKRRQEERRLCLEL